MNKMRFRSLISGMVAAAAIGLTYNVSAAPTVQNQSGAGESSASGQVASKAARAELATRLSQTSMMKKGNTNLKALSDRSITIVDEMSDDQVINAMSKSSHEELEAAVFGSQAARDLLSSLVEKRTSVAGITKLLGDANADLVYNPLQPCRIMDTRAAVGPLTAFTNRNFDISAAAITAQGGVATGGCGVPSAARAISVNITVIGAGSGYLFIWPDTFLQPNASILNFSPATGGPIANAAVVSIFPSNPAGHLQVEPAGTTGTHVIMDVLGYFATPFATALDCTIVQSATVSVPNNVWTNIDAVCPAGRTVTGGGYNTTEGTLGYPGVWITNLPVSTSTWRTWVDNQTGGNRNIFTTATCCRIPGR